MPRPINNRLGERKYFIGIDPGQTGAICVLDGLGRICEITSNFTKDGWIDITEHNNFLLNIYKVLCNKLPEKPFRIITAIERAFQKPGQGGTEKIWRNYERLYIVYSPEVEITAQKWKEHFGIIDYLKKIKPDLTEQLTKEFYKSPKKSLKKYISSRLPKLKKDKSLQYQLQHICPKDYDWYKTTKTGKKSIQLDDGKIDAYCIAKYLYLQNKV